MSSILKLFTENSPDSDVIREKAIELGNDFLGWKNVKKCQVDVKQMTGGLSNYLFHVTSSEASATPFLIRIHRQPPKQVFTDTVNFAIFSEQGLGPKLFGFFDGARLEEFLPSRTMDRESVLDPEISRKVGAVYPKYHAVEMPISKNRRSIQLIREWLEDMKALGATVFPIKTTTVSYSEHPEQVSIDDISREMDVFEEWSRIFEDTVVYSHNDLACGNILELDSTKEIVLIDWEFSSYNWRGFDLAMFLSERAVDFSDPTPPGIKIHEELTDNPPHVQLFCEAYVDANNTLKNRTPTDRAAEIHRLIQECQFFWPLTHMFWAVWNMKYSLLNYDNGTDLKVQALDRFAVYFHLKPRSQKIYEELSKQ